MTCGIMNESRFGLLTEGLIQKKCLTEGKSHMPSGLMNESSFGLLTEGVITKKQKTKGKSHMYAIWTKQWMLVLPLLTREENRFLDASTHLYKRVCLSVGRLVGPSVRWSVGPSVRWSVHLTFFLNCGNRKI